MPHDEKRHVTYFGMYSFEQRNRVSQRLASLQVNFYFEPCVTTEDRAREWTAWDLASPNPMECYDLWVHSADLDRLGTTIVDMYPERRFGESQR